MMLTDNNKNIIASRILTIEQITNKYLETGEYLEIHNGIIYKCGYDNK